MHECRWDKITGPKLTGFVLGLVGFLALIGVSDARFRLRFGSREPLIS